MFQYILTFMDIQSNLMYLCMGRNIKMIILNNFNQNLFLKYYQQFLKCFLMNKAFLLFLNRKKILPEFFNLINIYIYT